jgi:membrane-associated phospholipid phosphatase
MNAESSRLRSTGTTSNDMRAIWPGALLVVYLAATGALLLAGSSRVQPGGIAAHFAVLTAIAAATWLGSVPRWLRLWAPLLALLFLYTEMPMLIRAAGHEQLLDSRVMEWERALFGSQPALEWAARWPSPMVSEVLHLAYLSYYPIIFSVPVSLYIASRRVEFSDTVFVLMLTFATCFLSYVVFPVAGPRYLWAAPSNTSGPIRSVVLWLLESRSSRGTAFPSSHVAVAVAQSLLAVRYFGAMGAVIGLLTVGLALGAVYGGFHYAVDVLAGALLGATTSALGIMVASRANRRATLQANAIAPT